jgi:adenylate kinase
VDEAQLISRVTKRFQEEGRKDDNPETFSARLEKYNEDTAPLLPIYAGQGKLHEVDGMAAVEAVSAGIEQALQ